MPAFFKDYKAFLGTGEVNNNQEDLDTFLENYDPYIYKNPCHTCDALIFSYKKPVLNGGWKILLIKRGNHPCIGYWACPGGFVNLNENLEDTAKRELEEETGVKGLAMEEVGVFGDYQRDPRARIITTAFMSVVREDEVKVKAGDDAAEALWFDINLDTTHECIDGWDIYHHTLTLTHNDLALSAKVLEKVKQGLIHERHVEALDSHMIAFDHAKVIVQAYNKLKERL